MNITLKTKNIIATILICVAFFTETFSQTPEWQFARTSGGNGNDYGQSIVTDNNGNIYITGYFESSEITTFGSTILTSNGLADVFVVKYNSSGNVVWAKSFGGTNTDECKNIDIDDNGNIYITGYFKNAIEFGSTTLTSAGNEDIFIAKLSSANGEVEWAKRFGNENADYSLDIATDNNNVYITGVFYSNTITFGNSALFNNSDTTVSGDIFIAKLSTADGEITWAKSFGEEYNDVGSGITVDNSGNSFISGFFYSSTLTFDTTATLTNDGDADVFITKFDADGEVLWAKSGVGGDEDKTYSLDVDDNGNVYTVGYFKSNSIEFGSGSVTNHQGSGSDIFIVKYDANGIFKWVKSAGGTSDDFGWDIFVDGSGNSFITGYFSGTSASFGTITITNTSTTSSDIFIAKYDANGNIVLVENGGGGDLDKGQSITVDTDGNYFITGYYDSQVMTFDSVMTTNSHSSYDIFIAKYGFEQNISGKYRTFKSEISLSDKLKKIVYNKDKVTFKTAPNLVTAVENVFQSQTPKGSAVVFGVSTTNTTLAKTIAWIEFKKSTDLGKLYTSSHTISDTSFPLDYVRNVSTGKSTGKKLAKAIKPKRDNYNNKFLEQGMLFKLNIAASKVFVTPNGFEDLILDTSFTFMGRDIYGLSLKQIANYMDSLATFWSLNSVTNSDAYKNLYSFSENILRRINEGFSATFDTSNYTVDQNAVLNLKKSYAVTLDGVAYPSIDVPIVKDNSGKNLNEDFLDAENFSPTKFSLQQNYPNPFNPKTTILFSLVDVENVSLKIYDVLGREISTLINNEEMESGFYEIDFDATNLNSGIYFYKLTTNNFSEMKKMILVK